MRPSLLALLLAACNASSPAAGPDQSVAMDLVAAPLPDLGPPDTAFAVDFLLLPDFSSTDLAEAGPCLFAMPAMGKFPATAVGAETQPLTLTVTNRCRRNTNVTSITIGGMNPTDFLVRSFKDQGGNDFQLPSSVPGGFMFTADVSFTPKAAGLRQASVLALEGGGNPGVVALLSGTGR